MTMETHGMMAITGLGLWTDRHADAAAWLSAAPPSGDADEAPAKAPAATLDRRSRRRASIITRALAEVFEQAVTQAGVDPAAVATVFGSAVGEANTMIGLLDQMWREQTDMSPMKFALSVHNAASGLTTIGAKNTRFTTSLAADWDTPAMALIEAAGLLACGHERVVVVCGDEAAPVDLVPAADQFELLAAAVVLEPLATTEPTRRLATLGSPALGNGAATHHSIDASDTIVRNPQVGLLNIVDAVMRSAWGSVPLDAGRGRGYRVSLQA